MRLARPFTRLPFTFDAGRLAEEVRTLPPAAWMAHPSGLRGNSAVALISRDGGDNDEFGGQMKATPHLGQCLYHRQVVASFGEVIARSRIMKLEAGAEVLQHVDFNYHWHTRVRIHIPIITTPDVMFYCGDQGVHMRAGECWIFDNWRRHNVINGSAEDRIHLVVDLAGSSRFWKIIRDMQDVDPDAAGFDAQVRFLAYEPGREVEILTERYNISPVMTPGELDALVAELIRDFENHPGNDPDLVRQYTILLTDFARDWREIWHRHGIQGEGIPHYQRLINRLRQALHPDRRALVTSSNDIGVNPVIVQRILRPALATERYEEFLNGVEN